ncbi:MAG: hypothetical protein KGL56_06755 [Alphaproteobacteria bacterium]|nr:hypothetical protein [Alphaproteobacteria bacterium]
MVKRLIALLIAAVFLVVVQPGAMAMPTMPPPTSTHMMDCGSQTIAKCDHNMPMPKQNTPCKNMAVCLGMLNCFAAAIMPANGQMSFPVAAEKPTPWPLRQAGHGLTRQPDNPPPIA